MTNLDKINQTTMSSREIADITGKQHAHVMEAIRNMEPAWVKISQSNFRLAEYIDAQGKPRPMYELTQEETLYVATKFNDESRAKLVLRWRDLETGKAKPIGDSSLTEAKTIAAKFAIEALNLEGAAKLLIVKSITDPLGLPTPVYAESKGAVKSATSLLEEFGNPCSTQAFNQMMVDKGLLVELSRKSKSSKSGIKKFKSLTIAGLQYGENANHPSCQQETQPLYYIDKFGELLNLLNLKLSA